MLLRISFRKRRPLVPKTLAGPVLVQGQQLGRRLGMCTERTRILKRDSELCRSGERHNSLFVRYCPGPSEKTEKAAAFLLVLLSMPVRLVFCITCFRPGLLS